MSEAQNPYLRSRETDRGLYIPTFYKPHPDLSVPVKAKGIPLGFTVGEVAEERRWAIHENGEILEQNDFADRLPQWRADQYRLAGKPPADTSFDPIPNVRDFVSKGPDPARPERVAPAAFDPNKPGEKPKRLYSRDGERWISAEDDQKLTDSRRSADERETQMKLLSRLQREGLLSAEAFATKVSELFSVPDVTVHASEPLGEGFEIPVEQEGGDEPSGEVVADSAQAPAQPVKRPRGRPRKNPLPQ